MALRNFFVYASIGLMATTAYAQDSSTDGAFSPPMAAGAGQQMRPPMALHVVIEQYADELGITDAVLEQIESIAESNRTALQEYQQRVMEAHAVLRDMMNSPETSREAIDSQVETLGRFETDLLRHQLGVQMDIFALLSSDQRAALEAMGIGTGVAGEEPLKFPPVAPLAPQ